MRTREELVALFGPERVAEVIEEYENEVEALMKGDGRSRQRAFDTNWPDSLPKPTTDGDMTLYCIILVARLTRG